MKLIQNTAVKMYLFVLLMLFNVIAFAQDQTGSTTSGGSSAGSSSTTTSTSTSETWYAQPWVWAVGGVVLLLILIALLRGGSSSGRTDRVTVTKTVDRDTI